MWSNTLSYTYTDGQEVYVAPAHETEIEITYTPKTLDSTSQTSEELTLGDVHIAANATTDLYLSYIRFVIESQDDIPLPIKKLTLDEDAYTAFISRDESGSYIAEFRDIHIKDFESTNLDLVLEPSDNLETLEISLYPHSAHFTAVNHTDFTPHIETQDLTHLMYQDISGEYIYVPCFDADSEYVHCTEAGFTEKLGYTFSAQ